MREFGGRDWVDVTSRLFWEIAYKSSSVLVWLGLCRVDFVRLAGERRGALLLLGNADEGDFGTGVHRHDVIIILEDRVQK